MTSDKKNDIIKTESEETAMNIKSYLVNNSNQKTIDKRQKK
nr:MAG TPA: hypothetical protein [Microviridae sp.]